MHTVVVSDTKVLDLEGDAFGPDVELVRTGAHAPEAVIDAARDADALIVDSETRVTREVFDALDLTVVGRSGIGVDNVDVAAAAEFGVPVVNVPDYCIDEVATHALSLLLACFRRLHAFDRSVRAGEWDWSVGQPIPRLAGSTVGLVGFGKIGRRTAAKLRGFDVDVLAHDPYVADYRMRDLDVEQVDFDDLLARSDACSIHVPLTDETRGMFGAVEFSAMRDDAVLVNTARGPVVDEAALHDALVEGELAAAGLDVREDEPPGNSPLHGLENVVLTPHVAWYSEASRRQLTETVVTDVRRVLDGESPENPVDPDSGWF